ncbi:hypothetical protein [Paenibacillus marinisediminis]
MTDHMLGDNTISGIGKIYGGEFNRVTIDGVAEVTGDVTCNLFECNGKGKVKGNIAAKSIHVQGLCKFMHAVQAEQIRIDGSATMEERTSAEKIEVNGAISVDGDCQAEEFVAHGKVDIFGLLNAEKIYLEFVAKCKVGSMGGESIVVKRGKQKHDIMNKMISSVFGNPQLLVDTVEGDRIALENTKAKTVRGNSVTIGPGCEIDHVEYHSELFVDDRARVYNRIRM